jgi:hypothetical protein
MRLDFPAAHVAHDDRPAACRLPASHRPLTARRPDALEPGIHCVRTQWIWNFMALRLIRRTRSVMLMVSAWPESGFLGRHTAAAD